MSRAIHAPNRFQDNLDASRAEWLRFEDELQARFLCLFSENGIAIPEGHPVEESQWRDLAICLAIKSGELSVNLGGENLPSPPISWQRLDSMKETKERRDFRPALDKDLLKDELFRFFYYALRRERGGDYAKPISPVMWRRYYNRKTIYVRDYGFPPAMQRLSLRFQQCAEMDRLREAR